MGNQLTTELGYLKSCSLQQQVNRTTRTTDGESQGYLVFGRLHPGKEFQFSECNSACRGLTGRGLPVFVPIVCMNLYNCLKQ